MRKSDLIRCVIRLNPTLPEPICRALVERFFDAIANRLVDGGDIELRGFGRFFLAQHAERSVRNPRTGEAYLKKQFAVVRFRPGKSICARLNPDV